MSFGENLQYLRKKNDITQEQLAEQLGVSRQSVSKWESDGAYPEMEKILTLCEMFSCNMDTLMRGNAEETVKEDTAHYDAHMNSFSKWMAFGVAFILFSIGLEGFLSALLVPGEISDCILLLGIAASVVIFVVKGLDHDRFKRRNPHINQFYTDDVIEKFEKRFLWMIAIPVGAIIVNVACNSPLQSLFEKYGLSTDYADCIFLWVIALAVGMLVYAGIQKSKYSIEDYNKDNEYKPIVTEQDKLAENARTKTGKWCSVVMLGATILFLLSIGVEIFTSMGKGFDWRTSIMAVSWLVYPIGGIICGIIAIIFNVKKD